MLNRILVLLNYGKKLIRRIHPSKRKWCKVSIIIKSIRELLCWP